MSCGALARISPSSPTPARLPSSFTSLSSTPGIAAPSVLASSSSSRGPTAIVRIGASVSP